MKRLIILILLFILYACITLMHDKSNPCTNNRDTVECAYWKKQYPHEYRNYKVRQYKDTVKL